MSTERLRVVNLLRTLAQLHVKMEEGSKPSSPTMKWGTESCTSEATQEVFWPGQTTWFCDPCAARAMKIAAAMGFAVEVRPGVPLPDLLKTIEEEINPVGAAMRRAAELGKEYARRKTDEGATCTCNDEQIASMRFDPDCLLHGK